MVSTARGLRVTKAESSGAGAQRDPRGEWALSSLARVCVPFHPRAEFRLPRAAARGRPRSPASCLGGVPSGREQRSWDAPRASRHRRGSSVLHALPGKVQPGTPRRGKPSGTGSSMTKVRTSPRPSQRPSPDPGRRRPVHAALRGLSPPPAPEAPGSLNFSPMKPNPDLFQDSPQVAQPNPPPTLILSDHEPVLPSGVGEGWERLPLRGETQDVSQKMQMGSPLNPRSRGDLPRSSDHPAPRRGSRCEVEASPAPHPDSSRESLPPGPQGDRHPSGTPRSRGGRRLPWLVAPWELRYPQCRVSGPRHVASERSESARFRDPRMWAGLPAPLWRQYGDCSVDSCPRRPFGACTEPGG